jgi:hypothetical protein
VLTRHVFAMAEPTQRSTAEPTRRRSVSEGRDRDRQKATRRSATGSEGTEACQKSPLRKPNRRHVGTARESPTLRLHQGRLASTSTHCWTKRSKKHSRQVIRHASPPIAAADRSREASRDGGSVLMNATPFEVVRGLLANGLRAREWIESPSTLLPPSLSFIGIRGIPDSSLAGTRPSPARRARERFFAAIVAATGCLAVGAHRLRARRQ